ncbi:YlbD family protein [Alkalihalobacillus sp. NPDC078783]
MASSHELHQSVQDFKAFVREHPMIMNDVRLGQKSLQSFYEEWSVLGADHSQWQPYKSPDEFGERTQEQTQQQTQQTNDTSQQTDPSTASEFMGQIMGMVKKMNVQDLQNHLAQFSSVLGNVQSLIQGFQRTEGQEQRSNSDQPFSFRRD